MRRLLLLMELLCVCAAASPAAGHDPDEGTLASSAPRIPEPMVYDLVRPLGAAKGEVEINSLFLRPLRRGQPLGWAPEIEYTFARGYGIELEVPAEGRVAESFKAALQGTLGVYGKGRTIHGWQALWERGLHEESWKADLLYLTGTRWHARWSTFTMAGLRVEAAEARRGRAAVWNQSVFFHPSRRLNVGLESNWSGAGVRRPSWLAMPQLTWRKSRYNVQIGAGSRRLEGRTRGEAAWRISREF